MSILLDWAGDGGNGRVMLGGWGDVEDDDARGGRVFGGDEITNQIGADGGALGGDAVHGRVDDAKVGVGEAVGELVAHLGGEDIILGAPDDQARRLYVCIAGDDLLFDFV